MICPQNGAHCTCTTVCAMQKPYIPFAYCPVSKRGCERSDCIGSVCKEYEEATVRVLTTDARRDVEREELLNAGGSKLDAGKPQTDLIDADAALELARVLTFGAKKYAAENWRKGITFKRVIAACLRHTWAILRGEDRDPETGLLHAAHLQCEAMFLTSYMLNPERYRSFDDRWKPEVPRDGQTAAVEGPGR